MNYIKESPFALKTVILWTITTILWSLFLIAGSYELITLPLAILGCSICSYINFTPMHEASHGNVAGKVTKYKKFEKLVGYISGLTLFIPYPMFRVLHLRHHSFTNDPEKDPDYWVATQNPIFLIIKCFTIKLHYYYHAFMKPTGPMKGLYLNTALCLGSYLFLILLCHFYLGLKLFFLIWFLSAVIALAFLALLFDWLPHYPHDKVGRYKDTSIIRFKMLDSIMLLQNYHLIHHLYPRVPFYHYKKAFQQIEQELIDKKCKII